MTSILSTVKEKSTEQEAGCLFALITGRRPVSRRNRASWYLGQLNKLVQCDPIESMELDQNDDESESQTKNITLISMTNSENTSQYYEGTKYLVTSNTRVFYLSRSIAISIILDLSPSIVSVGTQNDCVLLDSMFHALKETLQLLVKENEVPNSNHLIRPKVCVTVMGYTPFVVAKNNQVLVQNRCISAGNIDQVLVELWICLNRLIQELHELVTNTCDMTFEYSSNVKQRNINASLTCPLTLGSSIIRHPSSILDDIYDLGLFSSALMPRLSRLSILVITDGLLASSNCLNAFRSRGISISFISLASQTVLPDSCFGYTTYTDLMKFISKSTQGVYMCHDDLLALTRDISKSKSIPLLSNPFYKLFGWTLHCDNSTISEDYINSLTSSTVNLKVTTSNNLRLFTIDQPLDQHHNHQDKPYVEDEFMSNQLDYHDWRSFKQMSKNLDADFEQVLACLLREGYLIKSIHIKNRETPTIVAQLVLYWKHNVTLEQELTAPYWNSANPFDLSDSNSLILKPFLTPTYGDTHCQVNIHGSYTFLHDFYCEKKSGKRRSEFRTLSYKQFESLIMGIKQTYDMLQYLSRFYRDPNLSKVPSFLLHGNSLLFEQPHTHSLISTIDNVVDPSHQARMFSNYWQEITRLEQKNWRNLMHTYTLRLILEHDQPKHKNIYYQNANGRYTHIQCRRAMSSISNFIKSYASFALLEDSIYIKFVLNKEDDLREIATSSTKGFIVIKIKKILPIVVISLMFTSGIPDSHRIQIVAYLESQLAECKLRNTRPPSSINLASSYDNILKSKIIFPSAGDACCIQIKSPLERMLRIYNHNTLCEFLSRNLTYGLPGSCPFINATQRPSSLFQSSELSNFDHNQQQPTTGQELHITTKSTPHHRQHNRQRASTTASDQQLAGELSSALTRYDPVFGKYLYGVRLVHTINRLPHNLIQPMVANVLSKISAILLNVRIKQGFRIAYNKSGLLTLVVELEMNDWSQENNISTCMCQYLAFPPIITNCCHNAISVCLPGRNSTATTLTGIARDIDLKQTTDHKIGNNNYNGSSNGNGNLLVEDSSVGSMSGSLANSDKSIFLRNMQQHLDSGSNDANKDGRSSPSGTTIRANDDNDHDFINNRGEVKVIREYWIEQQYGISQKKSSQYHTSLVDMRYPEVIDHLYETDVMIFNCLLTYDLLQMLCDKMSPFYELDLSLSQTGPEIHGLSVLSPTGSTSTASSSVRMTNGQNDSYCLPSTLINGTSTKDGSARIPLVELEYEFVLVNFLKYCQFASLDTLLFREQDEADSDCKQNPELELCASANSMHNLKKQIPTSMITPTVAPTSTSRGTRKLSMIASSSPDTQRSNTINSGREHRSSHGSLTNFVYHNSICSPSLNHLFLETLHRRLKQIHDKELQLSERDQLNLTQYLKDRRAMLESGEVSSLGFEETSANTFNKPTNYQDGCNKSPPNSFSITWRCFMRNKGNQENLMIVFIPSSLEDVSKWTQFVQLDQQQSRESNRAEAPRLASDQNSVDICPIFVFRCSTNMINEQVLSFLSDNLSQNLTAPNQQQTLASSSSSYKRDKDISLHLGPPGYFLGKLRGFNHELDEIHLLNMQTTILEPRSSVQVDDTKSLELAHFNAFLRKIKNTVLKSRFSSLNDAYLSELFVHKTDIQYYVSNVDHETQKKYHVSVHLRALAEFIESYELYQSTLPKNPVKPCDDLLKSILLQKCGLFFNQPIVRFDEANPLMKQLHDKKLLFMMRSNYKVELPMLDDILLKSPFLSEFVRPNAASNTSSSSVNQRHHQMSSGKINVDLDAIPSEVHVPTVACSGLGANSSSATRLMEIRSDSGFGGGTGAVGSIPESFGTASISGSPTTSIITSSGRPHNGLPRFSVSSTGTKPAIGSSSIATSSLLSTVNESFFLEAFRNNSFPMIEVVPKHLLSEQDVKLRHEAHMAGVLKRKLEQRESHHYRRVLKSKTNHNQSHSAIDQALKRVDSLGRLEHFCLTPLLFSPTWRSCLAPVRDHTIGSTVGAGNRNRKNSNEVVKQNESGVEEVLSEEKDDDEQWHQTICYNYIKEYEQYIQTLGFNSVQMRYPSNSRLQNATTTTASNSTTGNTNNTGYLIKFLNSGCLVFKVGFSRPYFSSILYSIEGERFNDSNVKMNMTAFIDELDSIRVTLHLHSFTYDYHLRTIYSYIARRPMASFCPGYHLISFLDDFQKYYQKAPNYARNHILNGELIVTDLKVDGQQLYNYIVTHNTIYHLDVLEMNQSSADCKPMSMSPKVTETKGSARVGGQSTGSSAGWNHANNYVLIELKREKVCYKDGKDPDIFECGLLITHNYQQSSLNKNSIALKYFLLLTNQRDLYPKLNHSSDSSIVGSGCHRPIRLGLISRAQKALAALQRMNPLSTSNNKPGPQVNLDSQLETKTKTSCDQKEPPSQHRSEPSTAGSINTSNSDEVFLIPLTGGEEVATQVGIKNLGSVQHTEPTARDQSSTGLGLAEEAAEALPSSLTHAKSRASPETPGRLDKEDDNRGRSLSRVGTSEHVATGGLATTSSPQEQLQSSDDITTSVAANPADKPRDLQRQIKDDKRRNDQAICDEEITYLGYFSSEEMDMLHFLQEKTANLRLHLDKIVRSAETHYRRDYLWHKLMERRQHNQAGNSDQTISSRLVLTTSSSSADNQAQQQAQQHNQHHLQLSLVELEELIQIVVVVDLASLDPMLVGLTTMHMNWYSKLIKAFNELKNHQNHQHHHNRTICNVSTGSKNLLLYISQECTNAFVLMSVDEERGLVEFSLLSKDKHDDLELDSECRELINGFVNFCAAFMWSNLLV